MSTNLPGNGSDQPTPPPYGTPEYAEWWHHNFGGGQQQMPPAPPAEPVKPKKKRHPVLWSIAGVVVLIVVIAVATSGGGKSGKKLAAVDKPHSSQVPCVNSASMCPAGDPTDHDVQSSDVPSDVPSSDVPTEDPSTSDAPTFDPIGATLDYTESNGYDDSDDAEAHIVVTQVGTYTAAIRQDEFGSNEAPHEGTYRVFKVTMHVVKGTVDDVNSSSFRWEGVGGRVFDESEGNSYESGFDSDNELSSDGGAAGQTVSGEIIFDVPAGAGKLELTNFDSSVIGGWTVTH